MRMLWLLFALQLSACAVVPAPTIGERVQIIHVVERVKCEVKDAVQEIQNNYPNSWVYLSKWTGSFILRLIVEEGTSFAPSVVVAGLPVGLDLIGLNTSLSLNNSTKRNVSLTFGFDAKNAEKLSCSPVYISGRPLTSELGLREWLVESLSAFEEQSSLVQPAIVISNLDFIIDATGQVSPGIALRAAQGATITNGSLFRGNRKDTHTLEATFQ